jgi:hypothetical protein
MTGSRKTFRLQFFEGPQAHSRVPLGEGDLRAADLDYAIREAANVGWPTGARACRLSHGREVAHRFVGELDGRTAIMIVKFA